MTYFKGLFFVGILCLSVSAFGHPGGREGNGGNSVVCFNIPLEDAVTIQFGRYKMTPLGRKNISTATPLEHYWSNFYAHGTGTLFDFFEEVTLKDNTSLHLDAHDLSVGALLGQRLSSADPDFLAEVIEADKLLPPIDGAPGIHLGDDIEVIEDNAFVDVLGDEPYANYPKNCAAIQTVIRVGRFFLYDSDVWKNLTPLDQYVMRLHEVIYYVGTEDYKVTNSESTGLLVAKLFNLTLNPETFKFFIKSFKAGMRFIP